MKYIKQFSIILIVSFVGELFNYFLPLPIPGNIYGMVLMFILLLLGVFKIHQVRETAQFLIDIMPILFIPSAVGIITEMEGLKTIWWQIIVITIVTTASVLVVSGLVTQIMIRREKDKKRIHKKGNKFVKKEEDSKL